MSELQQPVGTVILAAEHEGMRVDYRGLLRQARDGLRDEPGIAEMILQLQGHLTELGQRWYAGDLRVVDELLQLYCIESDARRALIDASPGSTALEWQSIATAPHNGRVLVRCDTGGIYAAHWVQNPVTGDEAWLVCALEDGTQMLVHPVEWMPLPNTEVSNG